MTPTQQLVPKSVKVRWWLKILSAFVAIYAVLTVGLFVAMKQTPTEFGTVMSKLPMISMMLLPFEPLWNIARGGTLKPGDAAPDFRLQTYDHSSWVQLSSFHGSRPVVLIFGSYT